MATQSYDTIIVGGGLVGVAIAYGLVQRHLSVLILDEGDIAFRAARGNFGLIWVQSKGERMPAYARWTRTSSDLWPDFSERLSEQTGTDLQYSRPGGFHFCLSEEEYNQRRVMMENLASRGGANFVYQMMTRQELLPSLPLLGEGVFGASYSPLDGHVNSLRLLRALHTAFRQLGGRYEPNRRVSAISGKPGSFTVDVGGEHFSSAKLVLAAGNGTRELARFVGLEAPVSPERGQILVTAKTVPFLSAPTGVLRQTGEGSVLIGDSKEEVQFDDRTTPAVMKKLAHRAVATFPILSKLNVVRSWAALRIMTPDGFPVYQQSDAMPGAYVTCLHSGVTLAAAHAGPLAEAIAAGTLPEGFEAFRAERFHV